MDPLKIIDFSQYDTFEFCPSKWAELYLKGHRDKPVEGDGPLVLGGLFHEGLYSYLEKKKPEIPVSKIEETKAFKETVTLAQKLLYAYLKSYPPQEFDLVSCEKALDFPIDVPNWKGISKIDAVFKLSKPTSIKMWDGEQILPAGIYGLEHKTRQARNMSGWLAHWDVRMQADFEMLALKSHFENVRGVLVNTVEYIPEYVPIRTCPECHVKTELRHWHVMEDNKFGCPFCEGQIEVKPSNKKKDPPKEPKCYRFYRTRTDERLKKALEKIAKVAQQMQEIMNGKEPDMVESRCVKTPGYYKCEFFDAHVHGNSNKLVTIENPYAYIFE